MKPGCAIRVGYRYSDSSGFWNEVQSIDRDVVTYVSESGDLCRMRVDLFQSCFTRMDEFTLAELEAEGQGRLL